MAKLKLNVFFNITRKIKAFNKKKSDNTVLKSVPYSSVD